MHTLQINYKIKLMNVINEEGRERERDIHVCTCMLKKKEDILIFPLKDLIL